MNITNTTDIYVFGSELPCMICREAARTHASSVDSKMWSVTIFNASGSLRRTVDSDCKCPCSVYVYF